MIVDCGLEANLAWLTKLDCHTPAHPFMKMKVNLDIEGGENKYLETELRGFLG